MKWVYAFTLVAAAACGQVLSPSDDAGVDATPEDAVTVDVTDAVFEAHNDGAEGGLEADAFVESGCPPVVHTGSVATTFQIDALHSGSQLGDALTLPLCMRWKRSFIGSVSYPVVGSGNVFVTIADQANSDLYALDESTGADAWGPIQIASNTSWSLPAYDRGVVFVGTSYGVIKAFDATSGAQKWTANVFSMSTPLTPWNGLLFVDTPNTLYAFDELDGSVVWSHAVAGTGTTPTIDDSGVYSAYDCNVAYAFEPRDGAVHWQRSGYCNVIGSATPRFANGRVYTRASQDLMLSAADGSVIDAYAASTIPVYAGPNLAVVGYGLGISAVTTPDMSPTLWSFTVSGDLLAEAPIIVGANVVFPGTNGNLYVVDLATGSLITSEPVGAPIDFQMIGIPNTESPSAILLQPMACCSSPRMTHWLHIEVQ